MVLVRIGIMSPRTVWGWAGTIDLTDTEHKVGTAQFKLIL